MSKDNKKEQRVGKEILSGIEKEVDEEDQEDQDVEPEEEQKKSPSVAIPEELDSVPLSMREDLDPEEAEKVYEEKLARLQQVLSRGVLNDNLQRIIDSAVPEGYHGKFVRDTEGDIIRYRNLGYGFKYREGAQAKGTHGTGDSRIRVGDVVLMTISSEEMEMLREVRRRLVRKKLEMGREDYHARAAASPDAAPTFDESKLTIG